MMALAKMMVWAEKMVLAEMMDLVESLASNIIFPDLVLRKTCGVQDWEV